MKARLSGFGTSSGLETSAAFSEKDYKVKDQALIDSVMNGKHDSGVYLCVSKFDPSGICYHKFLGIDLKWYSGNY